MVDLYADMFELAPVSLWLEDFSAIKALFAQWRAAGVSDLRAHLQAHPECIAQCSRSIKVVRVNRCTLATHGARTQQELTDNLHLLFRDDMLVAYVDELAQLWDGKLRIASRAVNYSLSGQRMVMLLNASVLPGHEAAWDRVLVALENVTERDNAERHARSLFEHSPVALWELDFSAVRRLVDTVLADGELSLPGLLAVNPDFATRCLQSVRVVDVNWRTLALFGAADKDALLAGLGRVFRHEMRAALADLLVELHGGQTVQEREVLTYTLGGRGVHVVLQLSVLPGHSRQWRQVLMSMTDITARKQAEAALAHLSTHDALTGLHNRAFFLAELERLDGERPGPVSLLVIDVNGLKAVNDSHGHARGDALLRAASRLIEAAIAPPMTASRIGGDEFAVLLPSVDEPGSAEVVQRLREAMAQPAPDGTAVSLSIGAATAAPGEALDALVLRADACMYDAKRAFYAGRQWDRRSR